MDDLVVFLKSRKIYFLVSSIAVILFTVAVVAYSTYYFTSSYYENDKKLDIDVQKYMGSEIENHMHKLGNIVQHIKDFEKALGIEYAHKNEKEITLEERLVNLKNKSVRGLTMNDVKYSMPTGKPLANMHITSGYGLRPDPILKKNIFHRGVDIRANIGTRVYATAPGVVRLIQKAKGGYGKAIVIQHNMGFETVYGHLSKIKVKNGDIINKGDVIALSGNTGRTTGPHLHYETRFGGQSFVPIIR